jgi:sodium-dependent dicarboxylate transporter 2/3/5
MAFTLPVATPPNAIVFGSGYINIKDMVYAGILLSITSIFLITAMSVWWMPMVWGIDLTQTPQSVIDFMAR